MAEGGASSLSSIRTSDEVNDFPCTYCKRNVTSEKFCSNCGEYLCAECLIQHQNFTRATPHRLVGKDGLASLGLTKCSIHIGKPIFRYCCDHDELCCWECEAENYGSCNNKTYLPDVAKGISTHKELTDFSESLGTFIGELAGIQKQREADHKSLQIQLQKAIAKIASKKQDVTKMLDKLEVQAVKLLRSKHGTLEQDIDKGISHLRNMIVELRDSHNRLDTSVHTNDNWLFINMKRGKKTLETAEKDLVAIDPYLQRKTLIIDVDPILEKIASCTSFGNIRERCEYRSQALHKYCINTKGDKINGPVFGICELPDGSVLITDWVNHCIKMLDQSFNVCKRFTVPSSPYDVCCSDTTDIAISLPKLQQVQFVEIDSKMKLIRRIDIDEPCRGITYHNNKLYVTCGGGSLKEEGPGQVKIYNKKSGELLWVVKNDANAKPLFTMPVKVAVNTQGTKVFVSDRDNGVVVLDRFLQHVSTLSDRRLKNVSGVCTGPENDLFVCGWSNSVACVKIDGSTSFCVENIYAPCPRSVLFIQSSSTLIIGREDSNISVQKLVSH